MRDVRHGSKTSHQPDMGLDQRPIRALGGAVLAAAVLGAGPSAASVLDAPHVVTGFIARGMCSAAFVSGTDPERYRAEVTRAAPGASVVAWGLSTRVDRVDRKVTARLFGGAASTARFRDGLGCTPATEPAADAGSVADPGPRPRPAEAPTVAVAGASAIPTLAAALAEAFAEPEGGPVRQTKAVVIVKDGRIVAERYAPGLDAATPLPGFSMTKTTVNALVGILVRQGRLTLDQPAPVRGWQAAEDPRRAITIDNLLRHTSGLAMGSSLSADLASAATRVNRMKFMERDMAAFAEASPLEHPPGAGWTYSDGNYVVLARIVGDAVGGSPADLKAFARRELFDPLGIAGVTLEFDEAGTFEGSSQMFAPARAWARLGQLYLDDGMVGGRRLLPAGWVDATARPTPGAWVGYGAGVWTDRGDSFGARRRVALGLPADSFQARGQFGQYVVVVPSERLVVVRLGLAGAGGDPDGVAALVRAAIAATRDAAD